MRGDDPVNALRLFRRFGSCERGAQSDASTKSALKET